MIRLFALGSFLMVFGVTSEVIAGTDVKINSDLPALNPPPGDVQNESRISVDPTNSQNLVTAYNDGAGTPNSLGISYSSDGGGMWTDVQIGTGLTHPSLLTTLDDVFDPYIEHDASGNVYAGYVARPSSPTLPGGPESALYIEYSTNGGVSWSGRTVIVSDVNGSGPTYRFNDRPTMDVGANDLAVTWIKDVDVNMPTSDIYFSSSPLAPGLNFSAPITVNNGANGTDYANAPDTAIAPNGTVYVAWIDFDVTLMDAVTGTIKIDSSPSVAVPIFGMDQTVVTIDPLPKHVSTTAGLGRTFDDARGQSYPVIAADPMDPSGQTVYLAYAEDQGNSDEGNIYFTRSTDGGMTWSLPLKINDDGTSTDQMHPAIAVKPDGTIDLAWYDKRNSTTDSDWDVYIARSIDGGLTFSPNVRITDTSFSTPSNSNNTEPWMGEYLGLDVDNSNAYLAFTSSLNDSYGDVYFDTIANSAIVPEPSALVMAVLGSLATFLHGKRKRKEEF